MRIIVLVLVMMWLTCGVEARAERVSVMAGKAVVATSEAVAKAMPTAARAAWKGLRWVAARI